MFSMRDIYPEFGTIETTERTIPTEQARKDPSMGEDYTLVSPKEQRNIWLGIILLVVVMFFLSTRL